SPRLPRVFRAAASPARPRSGPWKSSTNWSRSPAVPTPAPLVISASIARASLALPFARQSAWTEPPISTPGRELWRTLIRPPNTRKHSPKPAASSRRSASSVAWNFLPRTATDRLASEPPNGGLPLTDDLFADCRARAARRRPVDAHLPVSRIDGGDPRIVAIIMLLFGALGPAPAQMGGTMFATLSWMVLGFCLLEGGRTTADCLSEER